MEQGAVHLLFPNSEVLKRGWRTEGVAEEILPMPQIQASFLHPFSYPPPYEKGGTILETFFWCTLGSAIVYFLPSLRGQTAKILICTKSGVSADSRKSVKKCGKVRKTALFAQKVRKKSAKNAVFHAFRALFGTLSGIGGNPTFGQINVFVVWPLRLGRKYTSLPFRAEKTPKHPNTKISPRIPCLNPPFSGAFNP